MDSTEWTMLKRTPHKELCNYLNSTIVNDHPLKILTVTDRTSHRILGTQLTSGRTPVSSPVFIIEPLKMALKELDPLKELAIEEMDPLSKIASEMDQTDNLTVAEEKSEKNQNTKVQSWSSKKASILAKFTTKEKITIVTSFLSEGEKVVVKAQSTAVDKVQHRLEQLDYFEVASQRKLNLSQTEYINRIELLNKELVNAWTTEQRVKSLKIVIQCAKLLADTDVMPFYPSKFVLITDILDIFGQLVYDRLHSKAEITRPSTKTSIPLPEDFTPDMVNENAKETCLNWFFKTASIRELVPRVYIEMALLKSYRYISTNECSEALLRLTYIINGIGNPLVAIYARFYLIRVGMNIVQDVNNEYITENFKRFLDSYHQLFSPSAKADIARQNIKLPVYMTFFIPALDYILEAVALNAPPQLLNDLLVVCSRKENSALILNSIMSAFKPSSIAPRALLLVEMITNSVDEGIQLHTLLRTLGLCLSMSSPPNEQKRMILNTAWQHISSFEDPEMYINCAEAWVQYTVQHFSNKEINGMIEDLVRHLLPGRSYELYCNQLQNILQKIVFNVQDFEGLLAMESFLSFIDLFQPEAVRVEAARTVLASSTSNHHTNDPVITNSYMFLCSILHDSVNALSPDDEYRQIGELICNIIRKVDYGRDFERQLSFYVEARGAFSNIDIVLAELVHCVNRLSVSTRNIVKGFHTRRTGDFVRACAAYSFITIPSITSVKTRLELYLISGQVALFNQCLGQADASFKAALNIILELENEKCSVNELYLTNFIKQYLSVLLVVPDNPDRGILSIVKLLINVLQQYKWDAQNGSLIVIYGCVIDMLSTMTKEHFPYHIDKVESNDSLYGSDAKFIGEINKICSVILREIIEQLKQLKPCQKRSILASEMFMRIATKGDLSSPAMVQIANKLWEMCFKHENADTKFMVAIKDYLLKLSKTTKNIDLRKTIEKLPM